MKQRLLASGVVFLVGFGIGLGVTYALLAKKPDPAPEFAADPSAADLDEPSEFEPETAADESPETKPAGAAEPTDGSDENTEPASPDGAGEAPEAGSDAAESADGSDEPASPAGAGEMPEDPAGADEADGTDTASDDADPDASTGTEAPEDGGTEDDGTEDDGTEDGGTEDDGTEGAAADSAQNADGSDDGAQVAPSDGPWWEGLSGKVCRVDLGRARALTIRKGDLNDGDVLDWKASFGRNQRIGSLFKDDETHVTVHGVAVNAAGTPVAAKITLDKKGRETTGIIALHTQGLKVTLLPIDGSQATP